ncbi:Aste57867_16536 [Aphanomyces stellatus]|uniref:Aste57867_16536 protein n=1 Tax=Aphanomyces stellatus TaxID=120398 RepID=A0A485L614_9STRA|nr:hypothetical protein As57867_016479 [Aphanomyces stellatus]VFT93310.1 Aste57867_16536 [Aphanomyces stellatus]
MPTSNSPHKSNPATLATSSATAAAALPSLRGMHSVLAGVFAGCVTRTTTSPLDVLKILLQVNAPHVAQSPTVSHACRHLYVSEGIRGFWKGNLAGCFRLGSYAGVKFCMFDALQATPRALSSPLHQAGHGALAGMCATLAVYPLEVVRTRIILQRAGAFRGIGHELKHIFRVDGVRGLYRGCLSGLVGSIPFEGIQFGCYEYSKTYAVQHRWPAWRWPDDKHSLNSVDYLVVGSWSGAIAQLVSYPFDSVKKRLQADSLRRTRVYHGMVDCFQQVIRDEGALALFRGTVPNMVRVVPYAAVMFASYEKAKSFLASL